MTTLACFIVRSSMMAVIWLFAFNSGASSPFMAHVDKTQISAGETLTLTLEFAGSTKEEPDLSGLEQDFSIISRQSSSESTFVNGDFRAKTSWILELMPKKSTRELVIPPLKLGQHIASAITITQLEEKASAKSDGIDLRAFTDRDKVYVNGQVIFHIEIKTSLPLRNGSLSKLELQNAIIEPLG